MPWHTHTLFTLPRNRRHIMDASRIAGIGSGYFWTWTIIMSRCSEAWPHKCTQQLLVDDASMEVSSLPGTVISPPPLKKEATLHFSPPSPCRETNAQTAPPTRNFLDMVEPEPLNLLSTINLLANFQHVTWLSTGTHTQTLRSLKTDGTPATYHGRILLGSRIAHRWNW
ncbi:uncharacterized protein LACBIDRAFT_327463 [Laccaria bicolor S238N-H82]|uniref:Predicted protein n=1 Tax=Laccaria bicolor (strain S238N-H82 / ATCC MYA-4686) TaxID=486041 RepID=B0DB61_LACBS|nr:uncharacterized protein LACBIDRAFT_327463 [Laccaria bicolor S238N-H82]EDR08334.1 predicted protein [Laccaria bicolor S238N-H82]|eukprot:XP_001881404.1 predicted protein [Laccaria bicolor S238N-H82]